MVGGAVYVYDAVTGKTTAWARLAAPHVAELYRNARAAGEVRRLTGADRIARAERISALPQVWAGRMWGKRPPNLRPDPTNPVRPQMNGRDLIEAMERTPADREDTHPPLVDNFDSSVARLREAAERVGWARANGTGQVDLADVDELTEAAYALLAAQAELRPSEADINAPT
jgi:hypothetical protein